MKNKSNNGSNIDVNSNKYQLQAQAYLKAELGMDDKQALDILKTLSAPLKATLCSVDQAYEENNAKGIAETAHGLKGALLNLGLNELAEVTKRIEQSGAEKQNMLKQDLDHLHTALQPLFDLNSAA